MTIREIAAKAGVSVTTVSKIANGKDEHISPETRARVLSLIKEYNYSPYAHIKGLSSTKTFLIAAILKSTRTSSSFIRGIITGAEKRGYSVLLMDSQNNTETEYKNIDRACLAHVGGILLEPVSNDIDDINTRLQARAIPVLYLNSRSVTSAHVNFSRMGYSLTEKLLMNKHSRICIMLQRDNFRSHYVLEGFKNCLYDHQIPFRDKMVLYDDDFENYSYIITNHITGAVCSHFTSSIRLYKQLEMLHYYVPTDFSIVSLKSDASEEISYPRISCLHIPYQMFGKAVTDRIIDLCENSDKKNDALSNISDDRFDSEESIAFPPSMRSANLVIVGSVNLDETFTVDSLPQLGKTTTVQTSSVALGGKGANQAIGAAKLGSQVSLIGAIGTDTESAYIMSYLERSHISTLGVKRFPEIACGKAYIFTERNGESSITVQAGANSLLSPDSIRESQHFFENAGYCLISSEIPISTVIAAASTAKEHGVKTILKPATIKSIPEELYRLIDYFIPNRKEASALCNDIDTVEEQADFFFQMGIPNVIITLGQAGCYLKTAYKAAYFSSSSFHAIDTTGGADAFISAFATYLSGNYSIDASIRIATYAAGFCVSKKGVVEAMPTKETLESYIKTVDAELLIV